MDLTPITSMGLSLSRIIISFSFWDSADKALVAFNNLFDVELEFEQISGFYRPKYYLYTSFIAQGVNFVIYSLLLVFGIVLNIVARKKKRLKQSHRGRDKVAEAPDTWLK